MKIYGVGGAVRDRLLGLPVNDNDWVVVGATVDEMLAAGYTAVGRDFPVFLHPQTKDEYALARTERKSAPGYRGFTVHAEPTVTLEEDLARRDLTINAIAQASDGTLMDPFGGQRDLRAGVLRHVSAAFAEDPVRILRLARFAARWPGFQVAPETMALCQQMVKNGEADALVAERVWQELARGLMEAQPSRLFGVLRECGALARVMPFTRPLVTLESTPWIDAVHVVAGRAEVAPVFQLPPDAWLGVAGHTTSSPWKRVLLAGRQVLPGLGFEGEVLAAQRAVKVVETGLKKNDPLKTRKPG